MSAQAVEFSATEKAAMDAALTAALAGPRGANPLVGAVILGAEGEQLATGYHRGAGTAHAEADAISEARRQGIDTKGTTMVVTLEPCNHVGRTGPCAQAIIAAGIAKVIYAVDDPHDPAMRRCQDAARGRNRCHVRARLRRIPGPEPGMVRRRCRQTPVRHLAYCTDPGQPDRCG